MTEEHNQKPPSARLTFQGRGGPPSALLGLAYWYPDDQGKLRLRLRWRRFLTTLALLCLAGWLMLATAAWWFVTSVRHVPDVSFLDIALPHRWTVYQKKRGDAYIAMAEEAMEQKRYRDAFQLLRIGIARSPGNLQGRLLLAGFYEAHGRIDLASETLEGGLNQAEVPPDYVTRYLQLLLNYRQDERLIDAARRWLPALAPEDPKHAILSLGAAQAAFLRGKYDLAETFLAGIDNAHTPDVRIIRARIAWDRGDAETAIATLRALTREAPDLHFPHQLLVTYLRELGRTEEADALVAERAANFPGDPAAQKALLALYASQDEPRRLENAVRANLERLPQHPALFYVLADLASKRGDVPLAERLRRTLPLPGLPEGIGELVELEARLAGGEYARILEAVEALQKENPAFLTTHRSALFALTIIARFGVGDLEEAEALLGEFIHQAGNRPDILLALADRLDAAGYSEAAIRTLTAAAAALPEDETILARLIEARLDLGTADDLPALTGKLLQMRQSPVSLLRRIRRVLAGDTYLYAPGRRALLEQLDSEIARRPGPGVSHAR